MPASASAPLDRSFPCDDTGMLHAVPPEIHEIPDLQLVPLGPGNLNGVGNFLQTLGIPQNGEPLIVLEADDSIPAVLEHGLDKHA